jgi:hypothetical protein
MLQRLRATLVAGIVCGFASAAWAIPSLTPHSHDNPGTVDRATTWINEPPADAVADPDPDDPDATMHQHRDRDALDGSPDNGKYIGYSVWDNRSYRTGTQFGHGFIERNAQPRYLFEADFPALGRTDFDNAVIEWETTTNGTENNVNGVPIKISMGFERIERGAPEIDVIWDDIGAADSFATAFWSPAATDFTFDSNPTLRLSASAGENVRLGNAGPCDLFVRFDWEWFFGGAGTPTDVTRNYQRCIDTDHDNLIDTFVNAVFTDLAYDFYTIALHELGHAFGLDHYDATGGLMRTDIAGHVIRDPDAGALDGTKDLYAIPGPGTLSLFVLALSGLWSMRRRRSAARHAALTPFQ